MKADEPGNSAPVRPRLLHSHATEYIRQHLREEAMYHTLSSLLLQELNLERGHVWAALPSEVTDAKANQLDRFLAPRPGKQVMTESGRVQLITPPSRQPIMRFIQLFLLDETNGYCIIEDPSVSRDLTAAEMPSPPYLFYEHEVYLYLTRDSSDLKEINDVFYLPPWETLTAALTTIPDAGFVGLRQELNRHQLELLANGTQHLVIGASGGEGDIVWSEPGVDLARTWRLLASPTRA